MGAVRVGVVLVACLWLAACTTDSAATGNWFTFPSVFRPSAEMEATGSTDTAFPWPDKVIPTTITPSEPNDDLSLAKENFRDYAARTIMRSPHSPALRPCLFSTA
jgi:hypothetical protein